MTLTSILLSILIGAVAGFLAGTIMKGKGFGLLINIVVGIIGGFLGGWVFGLFGFATTNLIGRLLTATVGAVLLLWILSFFKKK